MLEYKNNKICFLADGRQRPGASEVILNNGKRKDGIREMT